MAPVSILDVPIQKLYHPAKYDWWVLTSEAVITVDNQVFLTPCAYISDGASKPRWIPDLIIPQSGLSFLPSAGHDYLYEYAIVPRKQADDWFREKLIEVGCPIWQTVLMYNYVRLLGWYRYGKRSKRLQKYLELHSKKLTFNCM